MTVPRFPTRDGRTPDAEETSELSLSQSRALPKETAHDWIGKTTATPSLLECRFEFHVAMMAWPERQWNTWKRLVFQWFGETLV